MQDKNVHIIRLYSFTSTLPKSLVPSIFWLLQLRLEITSYFFKETEMKEIPNMGQY